MNSLRPIASESYFTHKKTAVSYFLSVLIIHIHSAAFANYADLPGWLWNVAGILQIVVTRACVPLFFMISGALFFRNYTAGVYLKKLKSRVHSLVIPYFCWNVIMMLFQIVMTLFFSRFFVGRVPFTFTAESFFAGLFHWRYNNPFWFLMTLMIYVAAAPLLNLLLRSPATAAVSIAALALLRQFGVELPELLIHDPDSIVYYLIGGALGRFCWQWIANPAPRKVRIPALFTLILAELYSMAVCFEWLRQIRLLWIMAMCINAASIWICFDFLCLGRKTPRFMQRSFMVFAMHLNVGGIVTKLLVLALPRHWTMALPVFFLSIALTLVVIEGICVLLERFAPKVYSTLSGDR